jgi:ribonuclease BN (tRNA processing enzyme)
MPFACDKIPAAGSLELSSGARVSWTPLASHPGGSLAFRIDAPAAPGGKSIAYVTDTATDGSYAQLIQGVDLLIHECYFRDEQAHLAAKTGHSCASAVAQVAAQAQAKRLIIVHVDPTSPLEDPLGVPALRAIFPRVELGTDGLVVEV